MKSHLQVDDPRQEPGPASANSLRWWEFQRLLRLPETRGWLFGAVIAGGILSLLINTAITWLLPALALVVGLGAVFWIADRNAAEEFWEVYARSRGYELGGRTRLPEATPLLREGTTSYATRTLDGQIVPGIYATLALYTYEEEVVGLNGQVETSYNDFTLAIAEVPECAPYMSELYVQARRGPRPLAAFGEALHRGRRQVRLESEELDKRFETFVGEGQDELWTRRLFTPAFVVWLAESKPKKLSVELVDGALVAYVPGHVEDAKGLDALAAAAGTIARRLLEESAQTSREAR
ncbi:MAG: hypothetical protein JST59_06910 [Actinobacteria bacterium]|nr:hypothetical protein [Actinomycetota bacterium]